MIDNYVEQYIDNSLKQRTGLNNLSKNVIWNHSRGDEILRIIISGKRTYVSVAEEFESRLRNYLLDNCLKELLKRPDLYVQLLQGIGLDPKAYILEPTDELIEDRYYNCFHTLEYICTQDTYVDYQDDYVTVDIIKKGEEEYKLEQGFSEKIYCVRDDSRIIAESYYRQNKGIFENTCALQVWTRKGYRNNGYGKSVASQATKNIVSNKKIALWVCQVENIPSITIAKTLGYHFIGAEIKITR